MAFLVLYHYKFSKAEQNKRLTERRQLVQRDLQYPQPNCPEKPTLNQIF